MDYLSLAKLAKYFNRLVSVKLGVRLAGAAPVGGGQVLVVRDQLLFIGSLIFAVNTKVSLIIVGVVFDPFD